LRVQGSKFKVGGLVSGYTPTRNSQLVTRNSQLATRHSLLLLSFLFSNKLFDIYIALREWYFDTFLLKFLEDFVVKFAF
jgi:hypothetical protein